MNLSRRLTSRLNWVLDNVLPPFLRDSRLFMWGPMLLLFGRRTSDFMSFKERAVTMTAEEMSGAYRSLAAYHISRDTDLTPRVATAVVDSVSGRSVLDAGCGRGWLARRLAAAGHEVTGVDFVTPADFCGTFEQGSVESLPFPDASFDTVVCTHTLEHVTSVERAIAELRRVARVRLVIVVPRQRPYRYTFDLHLQFFPYAHSLRQRLGGHPLRCDAIDGDLLWVEDLRPSRGAR